MCFEFDAVPPELPADLVRGRLAGGAAAEVLELTSADATRFSAAIASSGQEGGVGVVVLPDVRGLYRFYVQLTERFAQAGHHAIAIDYFGRTAGTGERGEDFEYMPHVMQTQGGQIRDDTHAAIEELRVRTGVATIVTVGFCFGGLQSFIAATDPAIDGVVGFYGILDTTRFGVPSPAERAPDMHGPVLGLFGGADPNIPREHVDAFDRALEEAGVQHELVVYDGAPHSFFDRTFEEHAEASQDAWRRTLRFLDDTARIVR